MFRYYNFKDEHSQITPFLICLIIIFMLISVAGINLGKIAILNMKLSQAADLGALAGASMMAWGMNAMAELNSRLATMCWEPGNQDHENESGSLHCQFIRIHNSIVYTESFFQAALYALLNAPIDDNMKVCPDESEEPPEDFDWDAQNWYENNRYCSLKEFIDRGGTYQDWQQAKSRFSDWLRRGEDPEPEEPDPHAPCNPPPPGDPGDSDDGYKQGEWDEENYVYTLTYRWANKKSDGTWGREKEIDIWIAITPRGFLEEGEDVGWHNQCSYLVDDDYYWGLPIDLTEHNCDDVGPLPPPPPQITVEVKRSYVGEGPNFGFWQMVYPLLRRESTAISTGGIVGTIVLRVEDGYLFCGLSNNYAPSLVETN